MPRSSLTFVLASLLFHASALAGAIPAQWEKDVNGGDRYGVALKRMTNCKNTITVKLDESLTQDPWPEGETNPGMICDMVAEQVYDLCRDEIDDPVLKAFIGHLINDNIDSIVCERSPKFTSAYKGDFVPALSVKNGVLHAGIFFGNAPDGSERRYTSQSGDGMYRRLLLGDFLKAKGTDGALLNLRQANMRSYFDKMLGEHGTLDVITAKTLAQAGLPVKLDVTDAAILAAYAEEKTKGEEHLADGRELGFTQQVHLALTVLRDSCRIDDKDGAIRQACQKLKAVRLDTRKGLTSAEFDAKSGRMTIFIESTEQLRAEASLLKTKFGVGDSGKRSLEEDAVMLPVLRLLVHDLGLPKADTHCYACGSQSLWESGVLEKPLDAPYTPKKRNEAAEEQRGPFKKKAKRK